METNLRNKGYKGHVPILSRRKMRRTTLITEKNCWKAMGDINRFFKKPCVQLHGLIAKKIGDRRVELEDGATYTLPVFDYTNLTPNYVAYIGGECKPHSMYNKVLEAKEKYKYLPEYLKDAPWIAIQSKFYMNCVPIAIGDRYKIMGNRLVVVYKYDKYVNKTPYLRYVEFIHDPEQEFDFKNIASSVTSSILGDVYYLRETLSHTTSDIGLRTTIESRYDNISEEITKFIDNDVAEFIKNDMVNNPDTILTKTIKSDNGDDDIVFSINPKMLLDDGISGNFYEFSIPSAEYKSSSLINILIRAYQSLIESANKQNEVEEYDGYDPEYDYMWDNDTI